MLCFGGSLLFLHNNGVECLLSVFIHCRVYPRICSTSSVTCSLKCLELPPAVTSHQELATNRSIVYLFHLYMCGLGHAKYVTNCFLIFS